MALYDTIGRDYAQRRRTDPRIAARVVAALEGVGSVVNVGAGTGSYEPVDRPVLAVEPSRVMIRQRRPGTAPAICASASDLPLRDASFDAALAVLTLHHWSDLERGLEELRRAARRRVVILTCDPSFEGFWLTDYLPEILEIDRRVLPPLSVLEHHLGRLVTIDVPIPHDCTDGFLGAYWRRPHAYLRPDVRSAISIFAKLRDVEPGLAALRADLASGEWLRRYGHLLERSELDLGYRLVST
jgi:SAM-dependent methyltransferase